MQIERNSHLERQLAPTNLMRRVIDRNELQRVAFWSQNRPGWFVPKPIERYETWVYSNAPNSQFRLWIDQETRDLFITDRQ